MAENPYSWTKWFERFAKISLEERQALGAKTLADYQRALQEQSRYANLGSLYAARCHDLEP